MSFYLIRTIAGNEMKTLLRSWFFRIFALLVIFCLGIFNLALNLQSSNSPWIYRALSSAIPQVNLILVNVGQAIVAVFLASEFLKQDKKNDTIEVIYARSMSNSDYILGKTLGILSVFFVLNLIVLAIGIGFSFFNSDASRNILSFLAYPLLISLPTLVFILGLSFFIMVLIKNQAVTFIILLGYIALSIFYLNAKVYHLFDFIAYQTPMTYSRAGGFGNIEEIILQRSIYLMAGLGFISFTIQMLPRLSQARNFAKFPLVIAILFFCLGGFFMFRFYQSKEERHKFKLQLVTLNNRYAFSPKVTVLQCDLDLEHLGNKIAVKAILRVKNQSVNPIDTLIFSLNPSLKINKLLVNGQVTKFEREVHLLKIIHESGFFPGDSLNIAIQYDGTINEDVCFIDRTGDDVIDNFRFELFTIRKRYAFLQDNFVCLTSEALWYPTAGVGYATIKPFCYFPDFTRFTLNVKTLPKLTAISQGEILKAANGLYWFKPERALPKISLLIGAYHLSQLKVDAVEYRLYSFENNMYYKSYFNALGDTLKGLLKDIKKDCESRAGRSYPFSRFTLAEVPVHFVLDKHEWMLQSDAVQPEMIFYPEKGIFFNNSDFQADKYRKDRDMKHNNQEISPKELQAQMFSDVIRNNLLSKTSNWFPFGKNCDYNTYSVMPEFVDNVQQMNSEQWPVLNMALHAYLNDKFLEAGHSSPSVWQNLTSDEKIILEMKGISLESLMKKGIARKHNNPLELKDAVFAKGAQLFNLLCAEYGQKNIDSLLNVVLTKNLHQSFSFNEWDSLFKKRFGRSMNGDIRKWYTGNVLPGILIKDLDSYKVAEGDFTKYQVRFKVSNPEAVDGLFSVDIELSNPSRQKSHEWWDNQIIVDYSRKIFLPAHSAREVGMVFGTEPVRMSVNTYLSQNLPNVLNYNLPGFNLTKTVKTFDTLQACPVFYDLAGKDEFIVDNEDAGFYVTQIENKAFLKALLYKKDLQQYLYGQLRPWDPPVTWDASLESEFYGKYIHSARYTKAGDGERKAVWQLALKQNGLYEVSFFLKKIDIRWGRNSGKKSYTFNVFHDGGLAHVTVSIDDLENGWNSLGVFYMSPGIVKVELTNKSAGILVFADAVKWTKSK